MHNGYLNIEGEKMSKSIGNIITIRELLKDYEGEILRFAMLSTHYRQPINFSKELLESSNKQLNKIYKSLNLRMLDEESDYNSIPESLLDDMNTPLAISEIHELVRSLNNENLSDSEWVKIKSRIKYYGKIMGLFDLTSKEWFEKKQKKISVEKREEIEILIKKRNLARHNKNFKLADEIRENLREKGVLVEDVNAESIWKLIDEQ